MNILRLQYVSCRRILLVDLFLEERQGAGELDDFGLDVQNTSTRYL
jgi:hypothetical protein